MVFSEYPGDSKSLNRLYSKGSVDFLKGLGRPDVKILDTLAVKIGEYNGYRVKLKVGKSKVVEGKMLLLGDYMYFANYVNFFDFEEEEKNSFLNSIAISEKSPPQFPEESTGYKRGFAIGTVVGVLIIMGLFAGFIYLIVYLVRKSRR